MDLYTSTKKAHPFSPWSAANFSETIQENVKFDLWRVGKNWYISWDGNMIVCCLGKNKMPNNQVVLDQIVHVLVDKIL